MVSDPEKRLRDAEYRFTHLVREADALLDGSLQLIQRINLFRGLFDGGGGAGGCDPTLRVTVRLPDGTPDPGATVEVQNPPDHAVIATATADMAGIATFPHLPNRTVDVVASDLRGCYLGGTTTGVVMVCTDVDIDITFANAGGGVTVTVKSCGVPGIIVPGATVAIDDSAGVPVGSTTTNSLGIASFPGVVGPKGNWTAHVSGAGLDATDFTLNVTSCASNSFTVNVPATDTSYDIYAEACAGGCGQPDIDVAVKDGGGAVVGTGTTDSTGHATITVTGTPTAPVTAVLSSPDFAGQTITLTGNTTVGYDPAVGCVQSYNFVVTMAILADHYCYGGPKPPGDTDPVDGSVDVTLPNDPAIFGTLAGQTITCTYAGFSASNVRWDSGCIAFSHVPADPFTVRARVIALLPTNNCGAAVSGSITFTTYTTNLCSSPSGTQVFADSSDPGIIWDPVAFGHSYVGTGGVTFSWSVVL